MVKSKKSSARVSAKLASNNKKAFGTAAARQSAEKVVRIGNDTMKDFLSTGADEAQKAQEKIFSISRDGAQKLAQSADSATKMMYEAIAGARDNMESCIEASNVTAALAKDLSSELLETVNQSFADNLEMTKEAFACRTLNDMIELNNRVFRQACDTFFNRSAKLSNMVFEYSNEALEPINERVVQATSQLNKVVSA